MTRLPTDAAIGHLLDGLRALHERPRDKTAAVVDRTLLDNLERRLAIAVRRDRTGESISDGYPADTLSGPGGNSNSSTTETAALARPDRDRHHELTARACTALSTAVTEIQVLISALDSLDDLVSDTGPAPRICEACAALRPLGGDQPVAHRGTVGDRLARAMDLCTDCWGYVRRAYEPGRHDGAPPTPDQIAWHDQHGRWRIRTGAA